MSSNVFHNGGGTCYVYGCRCFDHGCLKMPLEAILITNRIHKKDQLKLLVL